MNTFKKLDYFAVGLALFAMFFGAGNIIFPLALGRMAVDQMPWGLAGLLLTAVAMPFIGLLAMFRYEGQIRPFFSRLGNIPGLVIAALIISLLGPFGAAPRCIALAHSTLSLFLPNIPLILFSGAACLVIFLFSYRASRLVKVLGYILAPVKIAFLLFVIIKGFFEAPEMAVVSPGPSTAAHFWTGLAQGYNTMDLLAAFFFAPLVISYFGKPKKGRPINRFVLLTSAIGGSLLAFVYAGFYYLAYLYAPQLQAVPDDRLLGAIAMKVLGPYAGLIVGLTVTFACLTTAIALLSAFANFIDKEIARGKVNYGFILILSLLLTFSVTTLEFQGIARFLNPILEVVYPALIALTFYNLFVSNPLKEKTL